MSFFSKTVVAAIETAAANEQSGVAALVAATDAAIQKPLDILLTTCKVSKAEFMKGNARTNDARKEVGALFEHVGKLAGWQESAVRNYQTSFWIAFRDGVPFDRNLFKGGKSGSAGKGAQHDKGSTVNEDTVVADLVRLANHLYALDQEENVMSLQRWAKKAGFEFVIETAAE